MNPRNTAILALVVAALGAFVWFYEIGGEEGRKRAEETQKHLFADVEPDAVSAIELETADAGRARLERADGGWRLVAPLAFPADDLAADGLASTLAELTSEAVFEKPESLENYGLAGEPAVRFEAGERRFELRIGDKTPVGGNTYVATADAAKVHAVPTWRVTSLQKSVKELREARLLDFERDAVTGLRATWPGGHVALARGEGGWRLTEPLEAPADTETVDALLSTLEFLRADDFVDDPPPDAEAGLAEPAFGAELARGEEPALRFALGATADGQSRLARGGAEGTLFRVPAERLEDFPRSVGAYRFRQLAEFDAGAADRFELVFRPAAGEPVTVTGERGDAGWTTAPEGMAAGAASRLVTELSHLRAKDIAADALGDAESQALELAAPTARLRVFGAAEEGEEASVLADVKLGRADPERGIAAQRADSEVVYWLDFALAEHLPVSLDAFRNRFVSQEPTEGAAPAPSEEGEEAEETEEEPLPLLDEEALPLLDEEVPPAD